MTMGKNGPPDEAEPIAMPIAFEDYVKTIYAHTEWQSEPIEPITPSLLAARLGLAASSVTEMVKKLARSGLVTHRPYGAVTLTEDGERHALRMLRRHRLIETWLVQSFGYSWDEVHEEAEVLEHSLSDRLLEAIADQLGQPDHDPHGDPIPTAEGRLVRPAAVRLSDAGEGHRGSVVRISDRNPGLLRYFSSVSLGLGATVMVRAAAPFRSDIRVCVDGRTTLELGSEAAEAVWISA